VSVVIAIDGTAACGKGTLARQIARHYGFAHLDSGALYRLVALGVLEAGGDPSHPPDALRSARMLDPVGVADARLRSVEVGEAASRIAAMPEVRAAILQFQRDFANNPPGGAPGAVIDGRDIGTVICPDAAAKLFVDARADIRAERRWLELQRLNRDLAAAPPLPPVEAVKADLLARDARDRSRAVAPLKQADDAVLLDTSDLGIEAAFAAALDLIKHKVGKALAARHRGEGGPAAPRK
jgi:cytidylate kinase